MVRVVRRRLSGAEKAQIWVRWKRGESLHEIGRALGRNPCVVHFLVSRHGGVAPRARRRSRLALTSSEREEISRGLANGCTFRQIGRHLGRAPSTVSREVRRHGGRTHYRASIADTRAWDRARRPKASRLATSTALRRLVADKLTADWSPQQIAGWLKRTFPKNPRMHISHETIYLSLFVQSRGVLKKALMTHLRRGRTKRHSRLVSTTGQNRGPITDAVSIRERPAEVEDRAVPGHWEGDLLAGTRSSQIATLVERHSRFLLLVRLPHKDTASVVQALSQAVQALPDGLMASLT